MRLVSFMSNIVYLELISNNEETVFRIPLRSHFTMITGDSGVGKTYFIKISGKYLVSRDVKIGMRSSLPIITSISSLAVTAYSLFGEDYPKSILVLDEEVVKSYSKEIEKCKHFVVIISRSDYLREYCDARNTFTLLCESIENVSVRHFPTFNTKLSGDYTCYFTESRVGCSEYKFIEKVMPELTPLVGCNGRDNIARQIRKVNLQQGSRILIFMDLSASMGALFKIMKQCYNLKLDVSFVNYTSFEALLCNSKLVKSLGTECTLDFNKYKTLELFYEAVIYKLTKGTRLESLHKEFSSCFIENCKSCCEVAQSSSYLKSMCSSEGIELLKWYWNTFHPEWVPLTDELISLLRKHYNPKGFEGLPEFEVIEKNC